MEWTQLYGPDRQPSAAEIAEYSNNPLWGEINRFLQQNYEAQPSYSYSSCFAQPGWNVKYQKGGRSLCTLYPMDGYFIALVVIGAAEQAEAELLMPMCDRYTQELFSNTAFSAGGRWLMMGVTSEAILEDVKYLIQTRRKIKKKV
ncbi:DUF3788 domain-containing protein [Faecalispora anaeroviscerum]|uniref:DUF3788 domain-containing protein n=1 Tax=Faecalispora anaeroviscerum TaxID=2991836 RepID=UPI0024BA18AE|nr:DUF3788 domain-containing protein [Faecalispora anaeroviscerum]